MEKIINFSFSTNVSVEAYKSKDEARKSLYRTGAKEIGMGKMVEKLGFYRLVGKIAARHITRRGAILIKQGACFASSGQKFCFLEKCLSSLNF